MKMTHKIFLNCCVGVALIATPAFAQTTTFSDQTPGHSQGGFVSVISDLQEPTTEAAPQEDGPAVNNYLSNSNCDGVGCDGNGCDGVGCGAGCAGMGQSCLGGRLGNGLVFGTIIKPSDPCFSDFISPMTNPVYFEDPRALTEARFIYLNHRVPDGAGGGKVQLYALQLRARLAENISLIATKDGYITSSNPLIDDGWADLSAGVKVNLVRNNQRGRLLSAGVMYEFANGSTRSLQGNGTGEFNLFLSGGSRIGQWGHWLTSAGWRLPNDPGDQSTSLYWSNHVDVQVTKRIYLLSEINWFHWTQSGDNGIPGVEGLDLFNFGSTDVTGNDIVTGALGAKFKRTAHSEIGVAYEVPLTERRDIIEDRITFDWIVRY